MKHRIPRSAWVWLSIVVYLTILILFLGGCSSPGAAGDPGGSHSFLGGLFGDFFEGLGKLGKFAIALGAAALAALAVGVDAVPGILIAAVGLGTREAMGDKPPSTTNNYNTGGGDVNLAGGEGDHLTTALIAIAVFCVLVRARGLLLKRWPKIHAAVDWIVRLIVGRNSGLQRRESEKQRVFERLG